MKNKKKKTIVRCECGSIDIHKYISTIVNGVDVGKKAICENCLHGK